MRFGQWPLQEEAKGDLGGGGGGDAAAAAATAAAAAAAAAAGGDKGAGKKDPSLLSQGADAAAQAAAAADAATKKASDDAAAAAAKLKADPFSWLPERFRVKGDGDAINVEESGKKVATAYAELEKRMKDTGLPPATDVDYKFTPPKGMEALDMDAASAAEAKKAFHAMGLTQKQYQGVMEMYVKNLGAMAERGIEMGAQNAAGDLEKHWGPQAEPKFKANLALAYRAFNAFADEGDKAAIDLIGNNPVYLRVLAKIGRELREDTSVGEGAIQGKESLEQLMKDPAYFDERHARHAEVKAKVTRHFEAQAAAAMRKTP